MVTNKKKVKKAQPKTQGYIRWTHEGIFCLEVHSRTVPRHGIRNLEIFCETVKLDIRKVRNEMRQAYREGVTEFDYAGWTFNWMNLDEYRAWLQSLNVKLGIRMRRLHGKVPASITKFAPQDRAFAKYLMLFMGK